LIDIAVPRDIDPDVDRLENVFLKNIDDLEEIVADSILERQAEAAKAREIVDEETTKFLTWYRARKAAPVIAQLRARLETIRQEDLSVLRARLGHLSERDWQAIETATLAMMNRVAREPILRLKRAAEPETGTEPPEDRQYDLLSAAQEIFGLVPEAPPTDVDSPPSLLPNETRDESAVSDRNPPRLPGSLDTAEAAR
jgi:glutamyl-tRNA reductase